MQDISLILMNSGIEEFRNCSRKGAKALSRTGKRIEDRGIREVGGQRSEVRGRKAEGRGQKSK